MPTFKPPFARMRAIKQAVSEQRAKGPEAGEAVPSEAVSPVPTIEPVPVTAPVPEPVMEIPEPAPVPSEPVVLEKKPSLIKSLFKSKPVAAPKQTAKQKTDDKKK